MQAQSLASREPHTRPVLLHYNRSPTIPVVGVGNLHHSPKSITTSNITKLSAALIVTMDHLPIPEGAQHTKLLYLGTEEYDGGDLAKYPRRMNWTEAELKRESQRPQNEIDAFFQTWLFFGCLITHFQSVGVRVRTKDFIYTSDGKQYLTTAKLPGFIEKWRASDHPNGCDYTNPIHLVPVLANACFDREIVTPVAAALKEHRQLMERYCNASGPVSPEVAIAIATLQWTLSSWQRGIGHSDWKIERFKLPSLAGVFLQARLKTGDWCPTEISWITREMELDGQYYAGCLHSPRYEDDHSECTEQNQKCGYKNKHWVYETQHTKECRGCDFIQAPENTVDIIQNRGTPIMSFSDGKLRATRYELGKTRYIAISHVWSDGIGNEKANALPVCQLERLQRLTTEVDYLHRHEPPPLPISATNALAYEPSIHSDSELEDPEADTELTGFWIDTLCVPIAPEDLRINQIGKMRHIYKDASVVLMLDKWVQKLATTADVAYKFIRLWLSNWQHRLWTCQEGVFARSLYFQFSDGQQRLFDLLEEAGLRKDGPKRSTIPSYAQDIPAFNEGRLGRLDIAEKFNPVLMAVRIRNTTKKKDETICIATLLGLSPKRLLRINKETTQGDICEKRIEKFIEMLDLVPQGLIFNKMEHLTKPGYRWVPRTFLGRRMSDQLLPQPADFDTGLLVDEGSLFVQGHGLLIHFPAYLLAMSPSQAAPSMTISDGKKYFDVQLHIEEAGLREVVDSHRPDPAPRHKIKWKNKNYVVSDEKYVLITHSLGGTEAVFCAMDTIIGEPEFMWPMHKLRYICPASVTKAGKDKGYRDSPIRYRYQKKWEWIIG
ncbi:hypothetical protein F4677DRAFT_432548 [Hypoxylon crocopeplum]|nr:hypothetical protein F4677DRAFT_432548 [Hypoxylon crocopeplum]